MDGAASSTCFKRWERGPLVSVRVHVYEQPPLHGPPPLPEARWLKDIRLRTVSSAPWLPRASLPEEERPSYALV